MSAYLTDVSDDSTDDETTRRRVDHTGAHMTVRVPDAGDDA